MNRMNLIILLDRLDQLIDSAPEIPLTGKALIDAEAALELVDKIRNAIPEEVKRAEWLASEKDRMLAESQEEAERMIREAEAYVAKMVSESELVRKAKEEALRILEEAENKARETQVGADQYAYSVLAKLEEHLDRVQKVVRRGREELQRTTGQSVQ